MCSKWVGELQIVSLDAAFVVTKAYASIPLYSGQTSLYAEYYYSQYAHEKVVRTGNISVEIYFAPLKGYR